MNYTRWIWWASIIGLSIIAIDEIGYFFWRRDNPGEHWSHLTENSGLQNWNEIVIGDGSNLNRVWSGRFA